LRPKLKTPALHTHDAPSKTCPQKQLPRSTLSPGPTTWGSFCSPTWHRILSTILSRRKSRLLRLRLDTFGSDARHQHSPLARRRNAGRALLHSAFDEHQNVPPLLRTD
jgi:hypothetical protein